jgi:hypothetical protein
MIATIKQVGYVGTYTQSKDTISLNWMGVDPKQIRPFLSSKCIVDSVNNKISFLDEDSGLPVQSLSLR